MLPSVEVGMKTKAVIVLGLMALPATATSPPRPEKGRNPIPFDSDVTFVRAHTEVVVLGSGKARVAVAPAWQGRVLTSTAGGEGGDSYGWINRPLILSGKTLPHMTPYGGEDRVWLGPEGGQFSIFFKKGDPFDFEHWQTPAPIDTEAWVVTAKDGTKVSVARAMKLTNHAGTTFDLRVERTVRLLDSPSVKETCGQAPAGALEWVAYQSENRLVNSGRTPWTRKAGLLSLWILGMLQPSPRTIVVVPARPGAVVNDVYFGKVPPDRLVKKGDHFFFRADGKQRGKIGLRPEHARPVLGSYAPDQRLLTVVWYNQPAEKRPYVNSLWARQKEPFAGDAVNAYNDGESFYELETSSPAAELAPGGALDHIQRTIHFQGEAAALETMARACLGVGLGDVAKAFPPPPPPPILP
jgi:hypothetical protein